MILSTNIVYFHENFLIEACLNLKLHHLLLNLREKGLFYNWFGRITFPFLANVVTCFSASIPEIWFKIYPFSIL